LYYGTYAIPSVENESVQLFAVIGGNKANAYAVIRDIDTITTSTQGNKLEKVSITNFKDHKTDSFTNATAGGYTFSYGGNDYFIRGLEQVDTLFNNKNLMYKLVKSDTPTYFGVNFLSYNYITEHINEVVSNVYHACYFNGYTNNSETSEKINLVYNDLYDNDAVPVTDTNLNSFIITDDNEASNISVGDYVNNISFYNNQGEAEKYNLIPGITRVITKVFINVDARNEFNYKGTKYHINVSKTSDGNLIETKSGKRGFYLFTTLDPVYISKTNYVIR